MSLQDAKNNLQIKIGNGSPDTVSTEALDNYVNTLCNKFSGDPNISLLQSRLNTGNSFQSAFFELITADIVTNAGATVEFLAPNAQTPTADLLATFENARRLFVEVGEIEFQDAARSGRHFVSDDLTDHIIYSHDRVRTSQSTSREQGEGGTSLASALRRKIREKARQLPDSTIGMVAIVRSHRQQIFTEDVFQHALWGYPLQEVYQRQTRISQTPVWSRVCTANIKPHGIIVITPAMSFPLSYRGDEWPISPDSWTFYSTKFQLNYSLPTNIVAAFTDIGISEVLPPY